MKKRERNAMPGREKAQVRIALPVWKKGLVRIALPAWKKGLVRIALPAWKKGLVQEKGLMRKRMPVRKQTLLMRVITVAGIALLLNACAKPQAGCNSVSCRPQSDVHKLTIWWQPELRNGPYDFTQVPVNN